MNFQKAEALEPEELFVQQEGKAPLLKLSRKGAVKLQPPVTATSSNNISFSYATFAKD